MFKKAIQEFKEFALKGNMMDMAVGLVMGSAFSGLVTQLTDSFITPLMNIATTEVDTAGLSFTIGGGTFTYGLFISAVINFFLQALVLFLVVKAINTIRKPKEEPKPEPTQVCPYCQSTISAKAIRCPHCTSELKKAN